MNGSVCHTTIALIENFIKEVLSMTFPPHGMPHASGVKRNFQTIKCFLIKNFDEAEFLYLLTINYNATKTIWKFPFNQFLVGSSFIAISTQHFSSLEAVFK